MGVREGPREKWRFDDARAWGVGGGDATVYRAKALGTGSALRQSRARPSFPKSLNAANVLKRMFRDVMRACPCQERRVFLDMFASCGRITSQLQSLDCLS